MIHKLSGIHETVDFREDEQVCLYYNDEYENYPPHWAYLLRGTYANRKWL